MTAFGDAIKRWRLENDLSQDEAAKILEVGRATLSRWELGQQHPYDTMRARIERTIGRTSRVMQYTESDNAGVASARIDAAKDTTLEVLDAATGEKLLEVAFVFKSPHPIRLVLKSG